MTPVVKSHHLLQLFPDYFYKSKANSKTLMFSTEVLLKNSQLFNNKASQLTSDKLSNNNNNNNNKTIFIQVNLFSKNEFAAINQGPVNLMYLQYKSYNNIV